jgi:hypothetical protein
MEPRGSPIMFMNKEVSCPVNRLDYESVSLSPETIRPTVDDLKVIHNLNRLDRYIIRFADYDEYAELLWDVEHGCLERFHLWLNNKGIEKHQDKFAIFAEVFLTFIYDYEHIETVTLNSAQGRYFEFMVDYLFRKTSIEPSAYTLAPTAIRLFYTFLYEKGYLVEPPDRIIESIDRLEPYYLDILRERFS